MQANEQAKAKASELLDVLEKLVDHEPSLIPREWART